jgi:quercetin dioxygenase-like cupin family protein
MRCLGALAFAVVIAQSSIREGQARAVDNPAKIESALIHLPHEPADEIYDNSKARFLVSSPEWSLAELEEAVGYKTPLHRHPGWDESFYVLKGTLTVYVDGKSHELPPGSFLRVPRGSPHGQANYGTVPVRFLLDMKPGGFERHLKDRIALAKTTAPDAPDFRSKMQAIRRKNADLIETIGQWER